MVYKINNVKAYDYHVKNELWALDTIDKAKKLDKYIKTDCNISKIINKK